MKKFKKKAAIRSDVKVVLSEKQTPGYVVRVQVVHWIIDDIDNGPVLVKQRFRVNKDGKEVPMRCSGLNRADIDLLVQEWPELRPTFF